MAERERPWQFVRPMAFEDVQISAADATGADLNQRCLLRDGWPRYAAYLRRGAWAGENRNANLFHTLVLPITLPCCGLFDICGRQITSPMPQAPLAARGSSGPTGRATAPCGSRRSPRPCGLAPYRRVRGCRRPRHTA